MRRLTATLLSASAALAIAAGAAQAQPGPGPGYGPGYGMGPGMMGGYGPGYGMGPGMMGGYGPGYGMGRGMMGGYGPGYGMGPGMMGGYGMHALWALDLNDAQRTQVAKIQDELRKKNWELAGKTQDEMAKLRDAYSAGKRDRAAIIGVYKRIDELRLARIENALDAYDRIDAILTPQQREQLKRYGSGGMMGGEQ